MELRGSVSKVYALSKSFRCSAIPKLLGYILMYYGTGRLWAGQKTDIKKLANTNTALGYYYSLKPDAQNKLLMPWIEKNIRYFKRQR